MQFHQLEYVLAVARCKGFTKAAEEINVSQSSISQQISSLEKELGIELFYRTTRSVQLTPAGKDFIKHASRIMAEVNAAVQCIQEHLSVVKGQIRIGIIPVIGHYCIPKLLASFNKNYPNIVLSLIEYQDEELLEMLASSKIDVAIVQHMNQDPSLKYFPLINDQMVALFSKRHPLSYKKSVHLSDLKDEKFIITPPQSGHSYDFYKACVSVGFKPNVLMTCSSVQTILSFVDQELGITVLSSEVAKIFAAEHNVSILKLSPTIDRTLYFTINKGKNISPALKALINFILQ